MACQWVSISVSFAMQAQRYLPLLSKTTPQYALTYLFKESRNESYEIIKNEPNLIQFKNEQVSLGAGRGVRRVVVTYGNSAVTDLGVFGNQQGSHYQRYRFVTLNLVMQRYSVLIQVFRLAIHSQLVA